MMDKGNKVKAVEKSAAKTHTEKPTAKTHTEKQAAKTHTEKPVVQAKAKEAQENAGSKGSPRATLIAYAQGIDTIHTSHLIVELDGVSSKGEAASFIGKKISFETPSGKNILGTITSTHGSNGRIKAVFRKGVPGQALGMKANISN